MMPARPPSEQQDAPGAPLQGVPLECFNDDISDCDDEGEDIEPDDDIDPDHAELEVVPDQPEIRVGPEKVHRVVSDYREQISNPQPDLTPPKRVDDLRCVAEKYEELEGYRRAGGSLNSKSASSSANMPSRSTCVCLKTLRCQEGSQEEGKELA